MNIQEISDLLSRVHKALVHPPFEWLTDLITWEQWGYDSTTICVRAKVEIDGYGTILLPAQNFRLNNDTLEIFSKGSWILWAVGHKEFWDSTIQSLGKEASSELSHYRIVERHLEAERKRIEVEIPKNAVITKGLQTIVDAVANSLGTE